MTVPFFISVNSHDRAIFLRTKAENSCGSLTSVLIRTLFGLTTSCGL